MCAGNFWWVDHLWSSTPSVPLSVERTSELGTFLFKNGPCHLPSMVHVSVDSVNMDVLGRKGSLWRVSPEEFLHCLIFKVFDRITNGATTPELERYKTIMLSVCFRFERLTGEDALYWRSWELRQIVASGNDAARRTAAQMSFEVMQFKDRKETSLGGVPLTVGQLQTIYRDLGNTAKSNTFCDGFVKDCVTVYDKLLSDSSCLAVINALEKDFGLASCLNHMTKLRLIANKTDNCEERRWVMHGILDMIRSGAMTNGGLSKTAISGTPTQVSTVEMLSYRRLCAAEWWLHCHRHAGYQAAP